MKKFAFVQKKSLTSLYGSFLHNYRKYDGLWNIIKISAGAVFFLACVLFYLYFITQSSTRGYFLKQENQKLNAISFQYEILKTKLLDYKQQNWDSIHGAAYKRDVVDINTEVVKLSTKPELGFLK